LGILKVFNLELDKERFASFRDSPGDGPPNIKGLRVN